MATAVNTSRFTHSERAILLENTINTHKNIKTKFTIPVLPVSKNNVVTEADNRGYSAPSSRGFMGGKVLKNSYTTKTYIELIIPKYITYQFDDVIPKDTEFLITAVGGFVYREDTVQIIGVYLR